MSRCRQMGVLLVTFILYFDSGSKTGPLNVCSDNGEYTANLTADADVLV